MLEVERTLPVRVLQVQIIMKAKEQSNCDLSKLQFLYQSTGRLINDRGVVGDLNVEHGGVVRLALKPRLGLNGGGRRRRGGKQRKAARKQVKQDKAAMVESDSEGESAEEESDESAEEESEESSNEQVSGVWVVERCGEARRNRGRWYCAPDDGGGSGGVEGGAGRGGRWWWGGGRRGGDGPDRHNSIFFRSCGLLESHPSTHPSSSR